MSRKPNHSLSSRRAKYDERVGAVALDDEPRPVTRQAAGTTTAEATPPAGTAASSTTSTIPMPTASSAGDTSRSMPDRQRDAAHADEPFADGFADARHRQVGMLERDADRRRRRSRPRRRTTTPRQPSPHEDGLAGAAKSSRCASRNTTTNSAMIASSMSRPLVTLPTDGDEQQDDREVPGVPLPAPHAEREKEQSDARRSRRSPPRPRALRSA